MKKRKFLTQEEITRLLKASRLGTFPRRDECFIKMCFIHGFRVSELCNLTFSDINLEDCVIHVNRLKNGLKTTHPLIESEIILLRKWLKERQNWRGADAPWIFLSQKGGQLSRQQVYKMLRSYGIKAGISITLSPHMLRHSCGYALANKGADTRLIQDYLGHRNIQHTVLYTSSNPERFIGVWQKGRQ
ncbi:tyrosine-type DNA invertase [Erwinia sorbitola]|uniref:Tyrosine-type recombinase/integrase n=1 Tax=Erwinia sorbitola TaxID=2681984 RepID=A0A6I6EH13_9GAMM|nr:tyrosine-type DNA invertase [Erwinia sorbitola]MTD29415.1 tyrosine-type recombinase/integrase [Erwinia sorbitola]QGU89167.1 tyrosine-type recombinase/integrase [Erwinia sorbitola]